MFINTSCRPSCSGDSPEGFLRWGCVVHTVCHCDARHIACQLVHQYCLDRARVVAERIVIDPSMCDGIVLILVLHSRVLCRSQDRRPKMTVTVGWRKHRERRGSGKIASRSQVGCLFMWQAQRVSSAFLSPLFSEDILHSTSSVSVTDCP